MRTVLFATIPVLLMLNIGCSTPVAVPVPVAIPTAAMPAAPGIDWNVNVDGVKMRTQAGPSGFTFAFTTPEGESVTLGASETGVVMDVSVPPL